MSLPRVAILDDYQGLALSSADWRPVEGRAEIIVFNNNFGSIERAAQALSGFEVLCLMRERQPLPASLMDRLPALKCVVTTGVWNAAIDIAAAEARGIVVCGTPNGAGQLATAELAWALMMALARRIPAQHAAMLGGGWAGMPGVMLSGRTLGLVGFGTISGMMAGFARCFGMPVIATSRSRSRADLPAHVELVDLDALLRRSDVVSLHVRLTPETRHLIGAREFGLMRPGALLLNTARGPLVDETALIAALQDGSLGGAALDVYDTEPLPAEHPLRRAGDRVLLSPHMGYVTRETLTEFHTHTRDAVLAWLDGRPIRRMSPPH